MGLGYNSKRAEAMKRKSTEELNKIVKSGTLSSAAALYELARRQSDKKDTNAKA